MRERNEICGWHWKISQYIFVTRWLSWSDQVFFFHQLSDNQFEGKNAGGKVLFLVVQLQSDERTNWMRTTRMLGVVEPKRLVCSQEERIICHPSARILVLQSLSISRTPAFDKTSPVTGPKLPYRVPKETGQETEKVLVSCVRKEQTKQSFKPWLKTKGSIEVVA